VAYISDMFLIPLKRVLRHTFDKNQKNEALTGAFERTLKETRWISYNVIGGAVISGKKMIAMVPRGGIVCRKMCRSDKPARENRLCRLSMGNG